jgi:hypothetical protein
MFCPPNSTTVSWIVEINTGAETSGSNFKFACGYNTLQQE